MHVLAYEMTRESDRTLARLVAGTAQLFARVLGATEARVIAEWPDDPELEAPLEREGFKVATPQRRRCGPVSLSRGMLGAEATVEDLRQLERPVSALFDLDTPGPPTTIRIELNSRAARPPGYQQKTETLGLVLFRERGTLELHEGPGCAADLDLKPLAARVQELASGVGAVLRPV
jgi:hypothetical protein